MNNHKKIFSILLNSQFRQIPPTKYTMTSLQFFLLVLIVLFAFVSVDMYSALRVLVDYTHDFMRAPAGHRFDFIRPEKAESAEESSINMAMQIGFAISLQAVGAFCVFLYVLALIMSIRQTIDTPVARWLASTLFFFWIMCDSMVITVPSRNYLTQADAIIMTVRLSGIAAGLFASVVFYILQHVQTPLSFWMCFYCGAPFMVASLIRVLMVLHFGPPTILNIFLAVADIVCICTFAFQVAMLGYPDDAFHITGRHRVPPPEIVRKYTDQEHLDGDGKLARCVVCLTYRTCTVMMPCTCACACWSCANTQIRCPKCIKPVKEVVHIDLC